MHGVEKAKDKNVAVTIVKTLTQYFDGWDLTTDDIKRYPRLVRASAIKRSRPIPIKLANVKVCDNAWLGNT